MFYLFSYQSEFIETERMVRQQVNHPQRILTPQHLHLVESSANIRYIFIKFQRLFSDSTDHQYIQEFASQTVPTGPEQFRLRTRHLRFPEEFGGFRQQAFFSRTLSGKLLSGSFCSCAHQCGGKYSSEMVKSQTLTPVSAFCCGWPALPFLLFSMTTLQ